MEANGMTMGDFVALEKVGNRHRGVANTGLALGAVALGVGLVGLWGVNAASQARSRAAENANAATQQLSRFRSQPFTHNAAWYGACQP